MAPLQRHTRRTEFKINGDISWEEMQRLIMEYTGQTADSLTKEQFQLQMDSLNREKKEVLVFMGEKWTGLQDKPTKNNKRKADELLSICRLLLTSGLLKDYTVEEIRESPDFIIAHSSGKKIGLELRQLVDLKLQQRRGDIKKAFIRAVKLMKETQPEITGTFNLTIDFNASFAAGKAFQDLTRNDKLSLSKEIAHFVLSYHTDHASIAPPYITKTSHDLHGQFSIELAESYILKTTDRKLILDAVIEKENNLEDYRNNTRLNEYWLILIVAGSGESRSFDIDQVSIQFTSTFDKVLIAEIFSGKLKFLIG